MASNDIFNVDEEIKKYTDSENKEDLEVIAVEFKRGHFTNVLSKTKLFRDNHEIEEKIEKLLDIIDAISHSQIGDGKSASKIIDSLFQNISEETDVDDLILYGNLAFMCDYRLTRKIMSYTVKQMEDNGEADSLRLAQSYLVLGEAEENLEKFSRAIKYYERSLAIMQDNEQDEEMVLFLHYKLGALHSAINETDQAIRYLEKTLELAGDHNEEMKINSLVSIAIMHGTREEGEKAKAYLDEAIPMLENSSLKNKMVHAEAHMEMAYYYFNQSMLDEAIPHYEKTIEIYKMLPTYSARKLGMIYMQYAYSLEHKKKPEKSRAGKAYEKAIEHLEKTEDRELLENALADVISFFDNNNNMKKKRFYENKFVKLTNEHIQQQ